MKIQREHLQLIHDWIHGEIQPDAFLQLQDLLKNDPDLRHYLRQEVNLDMALRDLACMDNSLNSWLPQQPQAKTNLISFPKKWIPWAAAALIAALALATSLFYPNNEPSIARSEETSQGAAILTRTANVVWAADSHAPRSGDTLKTGTLKLTSGVAQIEFFSGATVLLDGPAELEINSAWKATCRSGKIRARVPPPAQGFLIYTPNMEVEDIGTEFGVEVDPIAHSTEVHVFEGEVNARPIDDNTKLVHLREGEGLRRCSAGLTPLNNVRSDDFVCLAHMDALSQSSAELRFAQWNAWKKQYCSDPRILAFYTFQRSRNWERAADNDASTNNTPNNICTGGIVGARWTQGRWPKKDALEFKRPGDRIRIKLSGDYEGLTFSCWLKVDGLDRKYNALLLTDGFERGEPHWQILEDGRVMFSIAPHQPSSGQPQQAFSCQTPVIFTHANLGRWHHLAVTYHARTGETCHYFDGRLISRDAPKTQPSDSNVTYGYCEIGNWGLPATGHKFPIRNLNGCIDEFVIYKTPLPDSELLNLYQAGRQD